MKTVISLSAVAKKPATKIAARVVATKKIAAKKVPVAKDPIASAKSIVADCAAQMKVLQKQMDAAQKIIDKEAARLAKEKETAAKLKASTTAKKNNVQFFGVTSDGVAGKPNNSFKIAAKYAMRNGKVYAVSGGKKEYVAFWNSKDASGRPIKGWAIHFTAAGKKYQALNK